MVCCTYTYIQLTTTKVKIIYYHPYTKACIYTYKVSIHRHPCVGIHTSTHACTYMSTAYCQQLRGSRYYKVSEREEAAKTAIFHSPKLIHPEARGLQSPTKKRSYICTITQCDILSYCSSTR